MILLLFLSGPRVPIILVAFPLDFEMFFGVSNSTKNELENSKICPSLLGQKVSVRFLGALKKKCPFEIKTIRV